MGRHQCYFILEGNSILNINQFCMDFMGHSKGFNQTFNIVPIVSVDNVVKLFSKT